MDRSLGKKHDRRQNAHRILQRRRRDDHCLKDDPIRGVGLNRPHTPLDRLNRGQCDFCPSRRRPPDENLVCQCPLDVRFGPARL